MKKILFGSAFVLLLLGFFIGTAQAGIDQRCLSLCVNGGGSSKTCLGQCSYTPPPKPNAYQHLPGTSHDVLKAPQPAPPPDDPVFLTPAASPKAPAKDYVCLNQCLKSGQQYQQCSQSCTKLNCTTGSLRCKDLSGVTPSSSLAVTATR